MTQSAIEAAKRIVENNDKNGFVYGEMADEIEDGVTVARSFLSLVEKKQPVPSPNGTELALSEAKRHIATLIAFWMENPGWEKAARNASDFIANCPVEELKRPKVKP